MSERRDDTTEHDERDAPPARERAPQNYYYDDGTGYEVYDPATDEDEPDESDAAETETETETGSDAGAAMSDEKSRRVGARLSSPALPGAISRPASINIMCG